MRSLFLIHTILYQKSKSINGYKNKLIRRVRSTGIYLSISQDVLNNEIKDVALFLRQKILKLCEVNLPNQITVEAIHGQCPDVHAELSEFYRNLLTGSKIKLVKE